MSKTKTQDQVTLDDALTQAPAQATAVERVAPPQGTALTQAPEETGFEDFTQADLMVPFLNLLQGKSPQVEEGNPKQIPGAKAGSFINSVSGELFDGKTGIILIPVHRVHSYLEWIPRDDGGGLVSVYDWQDPKVLAALKAAGRKFGKIKINDNNDLVETFNVFCLQQLPDGTRKKVVLGFSSTQIGTYKKWMTNAMEQTKDVGNGQRTPRPLWSHRYRLTTHFQQNKKGTWHKTDIAFADGNAEASRYADDDPTMREAKEFRALLLSGAAQANFESAAQESVAEDDTQFEM